jgi:hypothetical protein
MDDQDFRFLSAPVLSTVICLPMSKDLSDSLATEHLVEVSTYFLETEDFQFPVKPCFRLYLHIITKWHSLLPHYQCHRSNSTPYGNACLTLHKTEW